MTGALKFLIKEITIQTYYSKPEPTYNTAQVHGSLGRSSKRQPTRKEEALFSLKMKYTAISRLSWKIFLKMMRFDDDIQNNNSNEVFFFVDEV